MIDRLLANPIVYRTWQAPFVRQKLAPLLAHTDMSSVRRVLDLGCGPGTNAETFVHADYVGIDINPEYVAAASRRYGGRFIVGDLAALDVASEGTFDMVLFNSILHHLDDADVRKALSSAADALAPGGLVHVLELVRPTGISPASMLARLDRGGYARSLEAWRALFSEQFHIVVDEPYTFGGGLWRMIYLQGSRSR